MHWPMITILGEGETQILQFSRREQNEVLGYMEKKKKKKEDYKVHGNMK